MSEKYWREVQLSEMCMDIVKLSLKIAITEVFARKNKEGQLNGKKCDRIEKKLWVGQRNEIYSYFDKQVSRCH